MSPYVLHRKLQKRVKHKRFRKCAKCGGRMRCSLEWNTTDGEHIVKRCWKCKQAVKLP